jgi:alkylation response protein AidB-like acyl-CoA dehydrogenase
MEPMGTRQLASAISHDTEQQQKRKKPLIVSYLQLIKNPPPDVTGVPAKNNRQILRLLNSRHPSIFPKEIEDCLQLLKKKTLFNHNSTTKAQRKQKIKRMLWLNDKLPTLVKDGKVYRGVELFAECIDESPVTEFLMLLSFDPSLATLWGVHYFLWGVSILKLGTKKHWDLYLERTNSMDIIGCCMMTEIGHGSNVLGLKTIAEYDHERRGFWVNSPDLTSCKCWIGGAAENATHGVGFFRLILEGKDYGVHPFALQIRGGDGKTVEGVETIDLGRKKGLNGVDNGIVKFTNLFIPYDCLLDHYCEIDADGAYHGKNGNKNSKTLIYKLMIQFIYGRKYIAIASEVGMMMITSLFYAYPPHSLPKPYFRRVAVSLTAESYALKFARKLISGKSKNDHWRVSIMKAIASEMNQKAIQQCIELYGLHPETQVISTLLNSYRADQDATLTYEGDNMLLYQLFAKFTLDKVKLWFDGLKKAKFQSWASLLNWALKKNKPRYILLYHCFQSAKWIGNRLERYRTNNEKYAEFCSTCQMEAINLAKMYGQFLILSKFREHIKSLERGEDKESFWRLYQIYAWSQVKQLTGEKGMDTEKHFAKLEHNIADLVARFGFNIEWMDAIVPPPHISHNYNDQNCRAKL